MKESDAKMAEIKKNLDMIEERLAKLDAEKEELSQYYQLDKWESVHAVFKLVVFVDWMFDVQASMAMNCFVFVRTLLYFCLRLYMSSHRRLFKQVPTSPDISSYTLFSMKDILCSQPAFENWEG